MPEIFPGVSVDREVAFGRPTVRGTGVRTVIIAGRFKAGESLESIADDYLLSPSLIEAALRFELLSSYMRRKLIAGALR